MTDADELEEDKETEGEEIADIPEGGAEEIEGEADFAIGSPVSTFDDDSVSPEDEDPHSSFNAVPTVEEDPHLDPYGIGAPVGYGDDEDEEDDLLEEDLEADSY